LSGTASVQAAEPAVAGRPAFETFSLDGPWAFCLDPRDEGLAGKWHQPDAASGAWRQVAVPHTWQIEPENSEYMGVGWYRRSFDVPAAWVDCFARIEFEAVFHTATIWVNGVEAGRHTGKGYTAFTVDASPHIRLGTRNTVVVRADNAFSESMLPRGRSSDWAHDGGIYRPVRLLVTPKAFLESLAVDASPDIGANHASLQVTAVIRNADSAAWQGRVTFQVFDDATGDLVPLESLAAQVQIGARQRSTVHLPAVRMSAPKLWHFDHPHLYRLRAGLSNGHVSETTFGVRKIEIRDTAFYLNGEPVRLMGVERMAGSNPEFGMAEPAAWMEHDHADMKELNCVYTRVHWPQDRRILDWCDRHGILMQTEVPTWGGATFKGMDTDPSAELLNNGLEQLREMIARDRNHPCIFSWGVCNEVNGQNPPAYTFARRMYDEAKRLDARRLVTYASNSLQKSPEKDVSGLMDYIMWNEYYESWYAGDPEQLARNLDEVHRAFPGKPIVISEYGYCACTADRPEGDGKRVSVLREHDRVFRERPFVAGLIFFDYNDYRTHVGDRGTGAMKQRVHGVVDVYGAKKPSWETLRTESSPLEWMRVSGSPAALDVALQSRAAVPAYTLRGYDLRAVAYGFGNTPVERAAVRIEMLAPGKSYTARLKLTQPGITRIQVDLMRPTGFSAHSAVWVP
jgi:beta-glucuronidase